MKDGDTIHHLAKVGADFCTGMGKLQQKKEADYDEDGSHNTGLQTLKLSLPDKTIFENKAPGGSELLRLISKSTHKDTEERMVEQMKNLETLADEIPEQVVDVDGVGQVRVKHHLVNCMHDGKERRVMVQHKLAESLKEGVSKKPKGFGDPGKVSTSTCMICLQDPKTYNQVENVKFLSKIDYV